MTSDPDPPSSGTSSPLTLAAPSPSESPCGLNIPDAELLLHFVSYTAPTFVLSGNSKPDDPIVNFWTHNVPRIGLSHHFVLHLMFAVSGYHLAHLHRNDPADLAHKVYASLAGNHLSAGLRGLTEALGDLDNENHGALYLGATLVCYCAFAAGPADGGDLLLCNVDGTGPARWVPLIRGLKYIRDAADPGKLWSGLMAPLAPTSEASDLNGPTFAREGFRRVDWVGQFDVLRVLIMQRSEPEAAIYARCLESLRCIYAATFGDIDGTYDGPPENQFVYGWLYRVEEGYVACLRRREPLALVLLAHFALLLRTMRDDWFMDGWTEHLLGRTREYLPHDMEHWVRWPTKEADVAWSEDEGRL